MEALAADVAGVLDALHVDRAALVGHSIGGYVALAFFRMFAERVAGLALVASHVAADASNAPNADPAQRAFAASRDDLAQRLETEGTMDAAVDELSAALLRAARLPRAHRTSSTARAP